MRRYVFLALLLCAFFGASDSVAGESAASQRMQFVPGPVTLQAGGSVSDLVTMEQVGPGTLMISLRIDEVDLLPSGVAEVWSLGAFPRFTRLIAIPDDAHVTVAPEVRGELVVANHPGGDPDELGLQQEDGKSPPVTFRFGDIRGQRVLILEIDPFRLDQQFRELTIYHDVLVEISSDTSLEGVAVDAGPFNEMLTSVFANSTHAVAASPVQNVMSGGTVSWDTSVADVMANAADYLFVVADAIPAADVTLLAQHRATYNNINVSIVRVSDILMGAPVDYVTTPPAIRNFIGDVYQSETAGHMGDGRLGYVLLIGDDTDPLGTPTLPTETNSLFDGRHTGSDMYFVCMADQNGYFDTTPDLFWGRLSVDDGTELAVLVNKIIGYEPTPAMEAWRYNITMVSGGGLENRSYCSGPDYDSLVFDPIRAIVPPEYTVDSLHRLDMPDLIGKECCSDRYKVGYCEHSWNPVYTDQFSQMAADRFHDSWLVGLIDHGNLYYLSKGLYAKHYEPLDNTSWPFVFALGSYMGFMNFRGSGPPDLLDATCDFGCPNSSFGPGNLACYSIDPAPGDCDAFAERIVKRPGGAVGCTAFIGTNGQSVVGGLMRNFARSIFDDGNSHVGSIVLGAVLRSGIDGLWNQGIFTDPMLDLLRTGDDAHVDLRVEPSGPGPYYGSPSGTIPLQVLVTNEGGDVAGATEVVAYDAPPGPGATVIGGPVPVPSLAGSSGLEITLNLAAGSVLGKKAAWIVVDELDLVTEYREDNNQTEIEYFVLPNMAPGFPVELSTGSLDASPVLADVSGVFHGDEILVYAFPATLKAFRAAGVSVWEHELPQDFQGIQRSYALDLPLVFDYDLDGAVEPMVPSYSGLHGFTAELASLDGETGSVELSHFVAELVDFWSGASVMASFDDPATVIRETAIGLNQSVAVSGLIKPATSLPTGLYYPDLTVGDIDGDGTREIGVSGLDIGVLANVVQVWRNDATLSASWSSSAPLTGVNLCQVSLADLDGDGQLEVVFLDLWTKTLNVLRYDPASGLTPLAELSLFFLTPGQDRSYLFSLGDLEADGSVEIVVALGANMWAYRYDQGILTELWYMTLSGWATRAPLLWDLNGDGVQDFLLKTIGTGVTQLEIYDGVTRSPLYSWSGGLVISSSTTSTSAIALGSVDLDPYLELAFTTEGRFLHLIELSDAGDQAEWPHTRGTLNGDQLHAQTVGGTYDVDLTLYNRNRIHEDVVVQNGHEFRVLAGSEIDVASSDAGAGGSDPQRVEFLIDGNTDLVGGPQQPIRVSSQGGGMDWVGLSPSSTFAAATVHHVSLADCSECLVVADQGALDAEGLDISNAGGVGIKLLGELTWDSRIANTTIRGLETGTGLYAMGLGQNADDVLALDHVTISDFSVGAYLAGNTWQAEYLTIESGIIGLACSQSSPYLERCIIRNNSSDGVTAVAQSNPTIRRSTITGNYRGVYAMGNSWPNLGIWPGSGGRNSIYGNSSKAVYEGNSEPGVLKAEYNWWGGCKVGPTHFYGSVDRSPALCEEPDPFEEPVLDGGDGENEIHEALTVHPNPFNPSTTIQFRLENEGYVRLDIHDVRGRLVRTLVDEIRGVGTHAAVWHGRDAGGRSVSSGVYLVRVVVEGSELARRKLLLMK